jgi:hypothetical protein
MYRRLLAVAVIGVVLAVASPASAGGTVLQFPLFTNGLIFFVTSGFSDHPIMLFGRPTAFPLIIQPILLVRQKVFAAPTAVVFLSPLVPLGAPILPSVPMTAPAVDSADYSVAAADTPTAATETVDNIARAPELYDRRLLKVTGTVSGLEAFVDGWGHPYLMFRLVDGYRPIIVLVGGQAANLRSGLRVQVSGVFFSEIASSGGRLTGVLQALAVTGPP